MSLPEVETIRDLRRAQILAEARALVAAQGLAALTFGTLEKRLPFTRGVITHHFKNKDEIVDAVLDSALADIDASTVAVVAGVDRMSDKIRAVLRSKVNGFLHNVEASRILISFWGRVPTDTRAAEINRALFGRYRGQSASLVRDGQQRGLFRDDADPESWAAVLVGQVIGIVVQALFESDAVDVDASVDAAAAAIHAGLAGPGL